MAYGQLATLALLQDLELIEISQDDHLIDRYGTRIPVLQRADTLSELFWPFEIEDILKMMAN